MEKLESIKVDEENQMLIIKSTPNNVSATFAYSIGDNMAKASRDLASFSTSLLRSAHIREGEETLMRSKEGPCGGTKNYG